MHFVNRLYRFGLLPFLIPVLLAGFLSTSNQASGQEILGGHVHDATSGQSLAGVNIFWLGSTIGTTTDTAGHFSLMRKNENTPLVFSMVGYSPDTVSVSGGSEFHVALQPGTLLTEMEIEGRRESASLIQPINTVTIDQHELTRGACCNLSESFETNADVDVEFTDAVSGAQQLRMLGLDGRYVQLLTENRPGIRGLALPYGLTYIPGTWMSSIQITKGPGSVVNGYEAMSGQLNVEYIRPENAGKLNLNAYGSVLGRFEANAHGGVKVGEHASMGWFGHGHWVTRQNDHNQDGFLDLPEANMFIGMNRWSLDGRGNVHGELGAEYIHQDLFGGQLDSRDADISVLYSNPTSVRRA